MALTVEIAGVDRTANVHRPMGEHGIEIQWKNNARNTAQVSLFDRTGAWRPTIGHDFVVKRSGTAIFGGSIDQFVESSPGGSQQLEYETIIVGYERRLDKRITTLVFGRSPFTSNAISDTITFVVGVNVFQNDWPVGVRTTGTLPAPLSAATKYYVINRTATTCQLSLTSGGSAINLTDDGAGNHHLIFYTGGAVRSLSVLAGLEGITLGTINDGVPLELRTYKRENILAILDDLGALSACVAYVSPIKELHFIPRNTFTSPFDISNDRCLLNSVRVRHTREEYANSIEMELSPDVFGSTSVNFPGDGTTRIFRVATHIESITFITVNAVEKDVGLYGVDSGKQWYYTPGDHFVYQDMSETILTGADLLVVSYRPPLPDSVFADDTAEQTARAAIETGTSGIYEKFVTRTDISSLDAGDDAAAAVLAQFKTVPIQVSYSTRDNGLLPGQLQDIEITKHAINGQFFIDEVTGRDEYGNFPFGERDMVYDVSAISNTRLGDWLTVFRSFVGGGGSVGGALGGIAAGSGAAMQVFYHPITLTTSPQTITRAIEAAGSLLIVILTQDATGGRQAASGSAFHSSTVWDIHKGANKKNGFVFYSDGTNWRQLFSTEVQ